MHVFGNYNKSLFPFFQFSRYKSELQQRKEENTSVGTVLDTTDTARSVSFLDPHIVIDSEGRLRTKHYDKSDDFNFLVVNFPFICSNIPEAPAYGIYFSQLIRYSRACGSYQDFLDRGLLLNQGFLLVKLKSSLRKFYGRHHALVSRYGISVSQMTTDMFYLS